MGHAHFVIERELPGAGSFSDEQICGISEKSKQFFPTWAATSSGITGYVTGGKIFCIYVAPGEDRVREHASRGGFPCSEVHSVARVIDPTTGGR